MPLLSVVIPFGLSKERSYIEERVLQKAKFFQSDENMEFIFVEGYSSLKNNLKQIIENSGHIYLKDDDQKDYFSQGKCRNLGAIYANSKVIMFLDVDCYISLLFLEKILNLIKIKNISQNINEILVLPVIYLNQEGSKYIYYQKQNLWDDIIKDDLISGKRKFISFFSLVSSSIIVNKYKFLELGGNNEEFIGHSYEDFDFLARLLHSVAKFEKIPKAICYDEKSWNLNNFKGFRAWFSLLGYEMSFHGIYIYHFYHEEPNQNNYMSYRHRNRKIFYKNLANLKNYQIKPLINKNVLKNNILLLCSREKLILNSLHDALVYLGNVISKNENYFFEDEKFNQDKFLDFLKQNNINKILFPNPYGNEKRLKIYKFAKSENINFICFDRGPLPDSWFFDTNGFNYDSNSYDEENWNKVLSESQILECKEYIHSTINGNNFLEKQGKRNFNYLKDKFFVKNKKIVFIPLQVESDTVIKYFTYKPFDWNGFLDIINDIALKLRQTHIFLVKKHPLGLKIAKSKYKNLNFIPNNTNIIDAISFCDVVVTLNSGVGLYAMIMNKPCINCANAFYSFQGLNFQAHNSDELLRFLVSDLKINYDKVLSFIWYLKNNFYSFGKSYYQKKFKNGRFYNKVYKIVFYKIVLENQCFLDVKNIDKVAYGLQSLVYTPYKFELYNKNIFIKLFNILIPDFIKTKISHMKFYRILKKFLFHREEFFRDKNNKKYKNKSNI
ncbi:TPA: glycosyltransferase [Campylobacter jejuni]|uniref:Glycosyltransferase n=4 Tax=Campylobacter jejuni TaxID=197 RepID=A0AAD2UTR3_CAMJU|nr:glycosyltransferase [Campylobacter jejuni]EAH5290191.1 glycosyltransferase [Campylobacter jejuni]EAH7401133.1 glycosyltransferase [Campylobacter jejuni]EAH7412677.1 glycosyltransferase [Campylobacter jejuni]EAH8838993.1 glycosyltransferase [Campylobacter jejuni]EAH9586496.1 glycosyltransferase [Campylobacter jejuni]